MYCMKNESLLYFMGYKYQIFIMFNKKQSWKKEGNKSNWAKRKIQLPDGRIIQVGQHAVPHTEAKASTRELIDMLKNAAKKGIFPPPAELA